MYDIVDDNSATEPISVNATQYIVSCGRLPIIDGASAAVASRNASAYNTSAYTEFERHEFGDDITYALQWKYGDNSTYRLSLPSVICESSRALDPEIISHFTFCKLNHH